MEEIKILVKNNENFHELILDKEDEQTIINYIKNLYCMKRKTLEANKEIYKGESKNGINSNDE